MDELSLEERLRLMRERNGLDEPAPLAPIVGLEDSDEDDVKPQRRGTREPDEIARLLDPIDPLDAYRKWCGKMEPIVGSKRESIMISCPNPAHPDTNPSAWINLDKGTYFCGGCQEGGDKYTIAGYHFNLDPKTQFPELRKRMAEDCGYTVRTTPAGAVRLEKKLEDPDNTSELVLTDVAEPDDSNEKTTLALVPPTAIEMAIDEATVYPSIPWRELIPEDTFLARWMRLTTVDDLPEEFYFWNGLLAVGLAGGRTAVLESNPAVKPNLFICLYGPTAWGKSRSTIPLDRLLDEAFPYDHTDPHSAGTRLLPQPGSGEALIEVFAKPIYDDPADPKRVTGHAAVRGYLEYDELSALIKKASAPNSTLKPMLQGLYDCNKPIRLITISRGTIAAKDHFCSTSATTQPRAVRDLLVQGDTDSGFVNRWVFVTGNRKKSIPYGAFEVDIDPLVEPLRRLRAWASSGKQFRLQGDALDEWVRYFWEVVEPIKRSEETSLLDRIEVLTLKLILLFCINEMSEPTRAIVKRATDLYPYIRDSYQLLNTEIGTGEFEDYRSEIRKFIKGWETRKGKGPSWAEIKDKLPKRYSRDKVWDHIKTMVKLGDIDEVAGTGKRGTKTDRYVSVA